MRRILPILIAGLACVAFQAAPAEAQASRTWVSGVGDDANPCSRTAPCKTFAGAISKTAAKGEISVLDPGGFGAVTITKSISIVADGDLGGILAAGTNGIIVNVASTDRVYLEGLDIEGFGTGINGVRIIGSGNTTIRRSSIRGFTGNAIDLQGTANARATIDNVFMTGNAGGVNVAGISNAANSAFVRNSVMDLNSAFSVQVTGSNARVFIADDMLVGSPAAISIVSSGQVISFGNNVIRNAGLPTTTDPLK